MRNRGEGPGPITRDGSAVELYLRLPYAGELERIASRFPPGCSVLELGCGTGRLTRRLLESGHAVTAVDNSAEMLRHVPQGAVRVRCDIERLQLGRAFEVVLYASNLVNIPDDDARAAQLAACREHLSPGGRLVFQRYDPRWLREVEAGPLGSIGDVRVAVERVRRDTSRVEMSLRYDSGEQQWRHHFAARVLDDDDVGSALRAAGFATLQWIDERWAAAAA